MSRNWAQNFNAFGAAIGCWDSVDRVLVTQQILLFFTSCMQCSSNGIQEGLTSKKYLQQVPWLLGMEDTGHPKQKKWTCRDEQLRVCRAEQLSTDSGFSNRWVVCQTTVSNILYLTLAEDTGFVKLYYDSG